MTETPLPQKLDRRSLLYGRWSAADEGRTPAVVEIASALVQVRPEWLDDVARAIEALPGSRVYGRSLQGKLVVVIEASEVGAIGTMLNTISSMPHVLTAALVFHRTDEC